MASLAAEIILEILESSYYTTDGKADYLFLATCSLISRTWTAHAQKLLFKSIRLKSAAKATLFMTHNGMGPCSLTENIRILQVTTETLPGAISPQLFARIVTSCPRLYELRIWSSSIHSLDNDTLAILSQTPPIQALSILRTPVQSVLLYQLTSLLPSVRHLRLLSELHATPPLEPAKFSLYEFASHRAPHDDVMMWLLGASHSSLRILEIWDMCGLETMRRVMLTHGLHIRSLRILHFGHQAAKLVRNCSNLEEFVLWHVPSLFGLGHLPSTIEHLAFRNPRHAHTPTLEPIVAAVTGLPRLRLVTCDENATHHNHFEMLRAACVRRGVELRSDALPFLVV